MQGLVRLQLPAALPALHNGSNRNAVSTPTMLLETVKIYVLSFVLWRFITKTDDNYNDQLSFAENLYVTISDICRIIVDLHGPTENDEAELQDSVYVMHIKNKYVIWYPINKRYANVEDMLVNWFLNLKSIMQNVTDDGRRLLNESNNQANDLKLFIWLPSYDKLVQFDENGTKWIVINESSLQRNYEGETKPYKFYGKSKEPDVLTNPFTINESDHEISRYKRNDQEETEREKMYEKSMKPIDFLRHWFPTKYTATRQPANMADPYNTIKSVHKINRYKLNEPLVRSDDSKINSSPLNESSDNENDDKLDTKDERSESLHEEDNSINWYPVNETYIALKRPDINVTRETKIIIHGYKAKPTDPFTFRLAYTLHIQKMYNVLLFDAEKLLGNNYFETVQKARLLGKAIADCIIYWESFGADAADFHLLGFSLGAHVAGWAGMYFRKAEGRLIGRITGLDPAGPCFAYVPEDERLDKSDAKYVDVIHTNIFVQGMFEQIGHSDFFVNGGGPRQPGCYFPSCSHLRAAHLYTESIKHPGLFLSMECESWSQFQENSCSGKTVLMGYGLNPHVCGQYYLRTSPDTPFGLGESGIRPDD